MAKRLRIASYGLGFTNGVLIRGLPINQVHPGEVFWVNNSSVLPEGGKNGSDGHNGSYLTPFATIDYAVGQTKSGRGDIIMVMPGHAESYSTVAGAGTSLNLDVADIAVVGLGTGSMRPTLTLDTLNTAHGIGVGAANISFSNFLVIANFAAVASAFQVGVAKYFNVEGCEFRDTGASLNFQSIITTNATDNAADGLRFHNNTVFGLAVAPLAQVSILAAIYGLEVTDNFVDAVATTTGGELISLAAKISLGTIVRGNKHRIPDVRTTGQIVTGSGTTSTGVVADNYGASLSTSGIVATTGTGLKFFRNYMTGAIDKGGFLLPAADSAA